MTARFDNHPDGWTHEQIMQYAIDWTMFLDNMGDEHMEPATLKRLQEHRTQTWTATYKHQTVDFGTMYVALVAHRYTPDVTDIVAHAMKTYKLTNSQGEYYAWSLHS